MKLLNIVHRYWPYRGGSEQYFTEMSERMVRDGHEVTVYTSNAWNTEYFVRKAGKMIRPACEDRCGVKIYRFPVVHFPFMHRQIMHLLSRFPLYAFESIFTPPSPLLCGLWPRILKKCSTPYDVVHASPMPFNSFIYAAYTYAKRNRIPFAVTPFIHVGEPASDHMRKQYSHDFQLGLLRHADLIFIQTEAEAEFLRVNNITKPKIVLLGMGVNPDEINPGDGARFRKKFNIPPGNRIILHIGSPCQSKGSMHIVEALVPLWERGDQITLVMAGPAHGDFRSFLRTKPPALLRNILILDFVQGEDKRDLFHACDIMVLPSRVESYGIAYLEAWLAKKPVIGARAGGTPHVIAHGEDGFIVSFGDVAELSNSVSQLLSKKGLAHAMGEAGFNKAVRSATWDNRYPIFRDALTQFLERRSIKCT